MSAVAVMAAQNPLGFDGTQMARKASKFKIIQSGDGCRGCSSTWLRPSYEPAAAGKLLNFLRIF
jgi:hypothetical protein